MGGRIARHGPSSYWQCLGKALVGQNSNATGSLRADLEQTATAAAGRFQPFLGSL